MRSAEILKEHIQCSIDSIAVHAGLVTEYESVRQCLTMLKNNDVWGPPMMHNRCFSAVREVVLESGKMRPDITLARTDDLFLVYPQKGREASRLAQLLSGGYALMQSNMGVQKSVVVVFLLRDVCEEETYKTPGLIRLEFNFMNIWQLWEGLYCLGHLLLAGKHNADSILWVHSCARAIKKADSVLGQIDVLINAYVGAEAIKAMGMSPYLHHFLWMQGAEVDFIFRSKTDMESFCSTLCDVIMDYYGESVEYYLGPFFHFLSKKMDMEYYDYFLRLLEMFRDGANSFREAVVLSTFTKWETLLDELAHEMSEELSRVIPVPFTLM